jgi:virginiamycin A acetyltransferase
MDLVMDAPSKGDTVVGNDVWLGYRALVLPGVTIGRGPGRASWIRHL